MSANPAILHSFYKLSVLMPVYNEIRTLRTIVGRVLSAPIELEIELVIVDDGSTDGSRELIKELAAADPRIKYVFHEHNQGKAAAVRTAIRTMTGDLALVQDADLEYNPADYPALLAPILEGVADAVFGSRLLAGKYRRVLYFWHTLGNKLLTLLCNVLNDINLTDMETGYKLVRADVLKAIPLTAEGFAFEPELTTKLAQWNLRLYEVPISYQGRTYAEGKKIGLKDLFHALWAMVKYRFFVSRFTTHNGFLLLQTLGKAKRYTGWVAHKLKPFVGRRVLEAGAGIGNFSEFLLDREALVCVDTDEFYLDRLRQRFGHLANVSFQELELTRIEESSALRQSRLDTIVCVNILEHVRDDAKVLRNFFQVLAPGGHAVMLVPAHPFLFSAIDQGLGHLRRYSVAQIKARLEKVGFEVVKCDGFNRLGSIGWFFFGKVLRSDSVSPYQIKLFTWLLPVAKVLEWVPVLPHLSLIVVARKPETSLRAATDDSQVVSSELTECSH